MPRIVLILLNILAIIPFILLCVALTKTNLKKPFRGRQFLMPVIAAVYCLLAALLFGKIQTGFEHLIDWLIAMMPSEFFSNLLSKIHLGSGMFYLTNYLLLLIFMLVKKIALIFLNRIWGRNESLMEHTSGLFYRYDEEIAIWTICDKWRDLRAYFKVFFFGAVGISSVLAIVMQQNLNGLAFRNVFYPVFGILIIGEVAFFLDGVTKTEFIEDILGEDEKSYRIYNYSGLRSVLKGLFGDRIIYDRYVDHSENEVSTFGSLDQMTESQDRNIRNAGNYFQKLKMAGKSIDMHYVKSCLDLSAGKSVLIYNPFYRDLTDYLMFSFTRCLLAHQKILIVAGRDALEGDIKQWMDESFFTHLNISNFWKTEVLSMETDGWDIGIVQFSEIHNLKLHKQHEAQLAQVGMVLLIEPSRIMASGQLGLYLLLSRCGKKSTAVYCACDRNSDGIVDALSHLLKVSITEVSASEASLGRTSEIYWQADGPYMHHKIMPNISRYLGVGSEIGAAAIRNQVSNVTWLSSEKFPVSDMKWFLGQYYQSFCKYTNLPMSQESIYQHFEFQPNLWQCDRSRIKFLIVEDEFCNLFEAMRLFGTRACEEGVINIISEEYLLREYMLEHVSTFQNDPKAIPSIVADYARTERNVLLRLLMLMSEEPVPEGIIVSELRLAGIETHDIYKTLQELFQKHCSTEVLALKVLYKEELSEDHLRTVNMKYYVLGRNDAMQDYMSHLKNAYYVAEDEKGYKHYIASKLYGHVFQVLLPGQFFSYSGKYYEVMNITAQNGVIVRRAADHMVNRMYYRQKRTVRLSNYVADSRMGSEKSINNIRIIQGYSDIEIETHGYYAMNSYDDLERAKYVSINGIPIRRYHNKSILRVELPGSSGKVRYTICTILSEMFRSIYPDTYPYIHVMSMYWDEEDDKMSGILSRLEREAEDQYIYFIEDSEIDLGLLVSIERNMKRYLEFVMEYLVWHDEKMHEEPPTEDQKEEPPQVVFEDKKEYTIWERIKLFFRRLRKKSIVPESLDSPKREKKEKKRKGRKRLSEPEISEEAEEPVKLQTEEALEEIIQPQVEEAPEETIEPQAEEAPEETIEPQAEEASEETIEPQAEEASEEAIESQAGEISEEISEPQEEQIREENSEPQSVEVSDTEREGHENG